jgi:hypothetical protein
VNRENSIVAFTVGVLVEMPDLDLALAFALKAGVILEASGYRLTHLGGVHIGTERK